MKKNLLLIIGLTCCVIEANAQISEGGLPLTFRENADPAVVDAAYQVHELLAPDMEAVAAEDQASSEKGRPYRIGINIPVSYNMNNSGTWEVLPGGDKIWRMGIRIPGAKGLSLYFAEEVTIPAGGRLHAYNERHSQYVGAYTASTPAFYAMEMIQGELITLEYYMPAGSTELPVIKIQEVAYYYRGFEGRIAAFGAADEVSERAHGSCEVDAMCPEADNWTYQRHSAVHYTFVDGGTYSCSANVINNTNEDCTPYILTANHCGEPNATSDFNNHVWYFNYQRPTCTPGNTGHYNGAQSQTMSGGIFRASSTLGDYPGTGAEVDGSDFVLCELEEPIPTFYHAFYAGWNRVVSPAPTSGFCFHHPAGDEKKISTYTSSLSSTTYNGGWTGAHWDVNWADTDNGWGVTEGGSSGSAIFNQYGQIVGHLSGGTSFCTSPSDPDLYGKFQRAWDLDGSSANSQLEPWLDPAGLNVDSLSGTYGSCGLVSVVTYENAEISVFPNPTNNLVTVDLSKITVAIESIELRDVQGRLVAYVTEINDQVELSLVDEMAGVYYVKINTADFSVIRKIVRL